MNKKFKLHLRLQWGALALIGLLVAGLSVFAYSGLAPKNIIEGDYIEATSPLEQLTAPEGLESLGGSSVVGTSWQTINGVTTYTLRASMKTATTTLCSFANPFGAATSTLESFDWQIGTGTSTLANIVIATSTNAYATSTSINLMSQHAVASNAKESVVWTPAAGTNEGSAIIEPSVNTLLITESPGLGGFTFTGSCTAKFRQMSF